MDGDWGGDVGAVIYLKKSKKMAIERSILETWGSPPSTDNKLSTKRYEEIKSRLENFKPNWKGTIIFLQWSYANSTNIKDNSDIDVIVKYSENRYPDISSLSPEAQDFYKRNNFDADYCVEEFKNDLVVFLKENFWDSVERNPKCISIKEKWVDISVDIIPCFSHKYYSNNNPIDPTEEWIQFISDEKEVIINYPKQHQANGERKNQDTQEKYKAIVRVLKNCKEKLVEQGEISEDLISSFFIESLVRNVPSNLFIQSSFLNSINTVLAKIRTDCKETPYQYMEINNLRNLFNNSRITPDNVITFIEAVDHLINY